MLKINERTVIERIVEELNKVTENILIVSNEPIKYQFLNVPMVEDERKVIGPLAGIHAGLSYSEDANRPRKASAWNGNQKVNIQILKVKWINRFLKFSIKELVIL